MNMNEHTIRDPLTVSSVGLWRLALNVPFAPGPGSQSKFPVCVGLATMQVGFSPLNPPFFAGLGTQRPISGSPVTGYSVAEATDDPAMRMANTAKTHTPSLVPLRIICIHSPAARLVV